MDTALSHSPPPTSPRPSIGAIRPWIALGVLVALLLWETAAPFFPFPKGRERVRHGFRNFALTVLNAMVTTLIFVGLWWSAAVWAESRSCGLLHALTLPAWTEWLAAILLLDAWTNCRHRINHRVPFLWRFHRVHHSDPHMDVTTASRFHTGEILISSILRIPLIMLLGASLEQLVLYEILMFAVVRFHHANISISEKWDRLFRSFRIHEKPESIHLGLDEFAPPASQTLTGMLKTPAVNVKPRKRKPKP